MEFLLSCSSLRWHLRRTPNTTITIITAGTAIIIGIETKDGGLRLKRELEAGRYQHVDVPLPAVLTIQSGINKLRYATLIGIKQAKMKPLRKVTWAEVEAQLSKNQQQIERLYVPVKQKKTQMLEGPPAEVAKKLVEQLKNTARVI